MKFAHGEGSRIIVMKKSVKRISRRMIAIALSVVMTLSGMTAYASENQDEDLQPQTIEAIEKTEELIRIWNQFLQKKKAKQ